MLSFYPYFFSCGIVQIAERAAKPIPSNASSIVWGSDEKGSYETENVSNFGTDYTMKVGDRSRELAENMSRFKKCVAANRACMTAIGVSGKHDLSFMWSVHSQAHTD